ncbi:hypothetical protein [Gorillibacterium sp. sgz5001074]|uniref:hypothetical protein n=1 Tax=Gorillibacterium sp. sgz5001074 TaxID=3446695 RepID=UPI003F669FFB
MDFLTSLPHPEVEIDRELLNKAVDLSQGDSRAVSSFLTAALRTYINKTKLEALGFKETLFRLRKFDEVKKVYCKKIAQHEKKTDENTHLNDPNFCGIIYPSTLTEVFLTARGNLIVQKSVAREILYCNGQAVRETTFSSSERFHNEAEEHLAPRVMDIIIHNQFEAIRRELPESIHTTVIAALNSRISQRLADQLDQDFLRELEL